MFDDSLIVVLRVFVTILLQSHEGTKMVEGHHLISAQNFVLLVSSWQIAKEGISPGPMNQQLVME